jgi:hypothetical protein
MMPNLETLHLAPRVALALLVTFLREPPKLGINDMQRRPNQQSTNNKAGTEKNCNKSTQ